MNIPAIFIIKTHETKMNKLSSPYPKKPCLPSSIISLEIAVERSYAASGSVWA